MTPELTALTLAALLQMLFFVLYDLRVNKELGLTYTLGNRDTPANNTLSQGTARLERAYTNHFNALALFTIAVLVLQLSGQNSGFTATCAWIYLIARIAYVPAYALGLPPWRSLLWIIAFGATALMLLGCPLLTFIFQNKLRGNRCLGTDGGWPPTPTAPNTL